MGTGGESFHPNPRIMTATVQIQSVGRCKGKAAGQLQVGDVTIWNFGYTHAFVGFAKETKAQVIAQFANKDGSIWEKRMGKDRLVAVI
jgi:hypothetical protein